MLDPGLGFHGPFWLCISVFVWLWICVNLPLVVSLSLFSKLLKWGEFTYLYHLQGGPSIITDVADLLNAYKYL